MELNQKTALVTGYNGFIGGKLCEVLLAKGWTIVGIDQSSGNNSHRNIISHKCDIMNKTEIYDVVLKYNPSVIIHLAGGPGRMSAFENYSENFKLNHQGSLNVIEAAMSVTNLKKFIFLGSCEEYGSIDVPFKESSREMPATAYGMAKLCVTHLLQALSITHKFPSVVLRPSVVYGPGQNASMFIMDLIDHLINGQRFDMSKGDQTRDYIYIEDLLEAIMLAVKIPDISGEVFNISSSFPIAIKDLALNIATQLDKGAIELINFGARDYRLGETMNYFADSSKSEGLLGWRPQISLSEGLSQTIDWRRSKIFKSGSNET